MTHRFESLGRSSVPHVVGDLPSSHVSHPGKVRVHVNIGYRVIVDVGYQLTDRSEQHRQVVTDGFIQHVDRVRGGPPLATGKLLRDDLDRRLAFLHCEALDFTRPSGADRFEQFLASGCRIVMQHQPHVLGLIGEHLGERVGEGILG